MMYLEAGRFIVPIDICCDCVHQSQSHKIHVRYFTYMNDSIMNGWFFWELAGRQNNLDVESKTVIKSIKLVYLPTCKNQPTVGKYIPFPMDPMGIPTKKAEHLAMCPWFLGFPNGGGYASPGQGKNTWRLHWEISNARFTGTKYAQLHHQYVIPRKSKSTKLCWLVVGNLLLGSS